MLFGLPAAAAGEVLDKTPNALRVLVCRAKAALKSFLCKHCSLYDPDNACRCENLVSFSLKRGWIKTSRIDDGRDLTASAIEAELRTFRDETALYRGLAEREPPEAVAARISARIKGKNAGIFSKN